MNPSPSNSAPERVASDSAFPSVVGDSQGHVCTLIIVVTYGFSETLKQLLVCLDKLVSRNSDCCVVVVDNTPDANSVANFFEMAIAHDNARRAIYRHLGSNVGFAAGVNEAYAIGSNSWGPPEQVLLLNPDVQVEVVVLEEFLAQFRRNADGVASPRLIDNHGNLDRGVARRRWNLRRFFAEVVGVPDLALALLTPTRNLPLPSENSGEFDVDITSGAFLAIKRDVIGEGLDTTLPMYLEDQEICMRAHKKGAAVKVYADYTARHSGGESRKSFSQATVVLRTMELAVAPALSMGQWTRTPFIASRIVMVAGGLARLVLTGLLSPALAFRREPERIRSSVFLSWCFVRAGMSSRSRLLKEAWRPFGGQRGTCR